MDRFSSREIVEFDEDKEKEGYRARMAGRTHKDNPYASCKGFSWSKESWNAGWADADMEILSMRQEGTNG